MAKKKPKISLVGLNDVDFDKELDISSAQSIIEPSKAVEPVKEVVQPEKSQGEKSDNSENDIVLENAKPSEPNKPNEHRIARKRGGAKKDKKEIKGTLPPTNKKRASFNISSDLHRALKDYSYYNEIEMVEYIFENLVKPDLKKKGFYPPRKRQ